VRRFTTWKLAQGDAVALLCKGTKERFSRSEAPLAQTAERLHGKEKVHGSIP
jgi:hypothetical protein